MTFSFKLDWNRIHHKKGISLGALPLSLLSLPYGMGLRLWAWAYKHRLLKGKRLPGIVISIGNLTTGGTGKTPAVMMLAKWAQGIGYKVAVLSRGYKGAYKQDILEVSDGKQILADSKEAGEEPFLLAASLKGIPVIVSKKRYNAGLHANRKFGSDFFILDDGFQHLQLERDLDIVLINTSSPFGNRHLLPWGPLREPIEQLERADICVFTRLPDVQTGQRAQAEIQRHCPHGLFFFAKHIPDELVFPAEEKVHPVDFLKEKRVVAFAGIADPETFRQTLVDLGIKPVYFKSFQDHHTFNTNDLETLVRMKKKVTAEYIVTTEKDWVKLIASSLNRPDIACLRIQFRIQPDQEETFFRALETITNSHANNSKQ